MAMLRFCIDPCDSRKKNPKNRTDVVGLSSFHSGHVRLRSVKNEFFFVLVFFFSVLLFTVNSEAKWFGLCLDRLLVFISAVQGLKIE